MTQELYDEMNQEIRETRDWYEEQGLGAYSYSADLAVDAIRDYYHALYEEDDCYDYE